MARSEIRTHSLKVNESDTLTTRPLTPYKDYSFLNTIFVESCITMCLKGAVMSLYRLRWLRGETISFVSLPALHRVTLS